MKQTIPVVSLRNFVGADEASRQRFVRDIGSALSEVGFFALEDHGVDADIIRDAYAAAEEFFLLPEAKKIPYDLSIGGQRGYTRFGREHAKGESSPDLKEFWHVGRSFPGDQVPEGFYKNVWPKEAPSFEPSMHELYDRLDACSMHLLDAISLYLGEEENFLRSTAHDGNNILRVIHYPPVSPEHDPKSIRAAAHEDINLITLLCESTAAGLELLQKDGTWLPIHSLKGQIIVDSGDMLQRWTNGLIKSTTHRVVNPGNSRERRYSMPFFVHPRSDVSLAVRPNCVARTGGVKKFPDIDSGDFLTQRLREIGLY